MLLNSLMQVLQSRFLPNPRVLILLLSPLLLFFLDLQSVLAAENLKKVAILPFQVYSKANTKELQRGIHEALSNQLRKIRGVELIAQEQFAGAVEGKVVNDALVSAIGKQTGAAFVISGSLTELGDVMSVNVRIMDMRRSAVSPAIFAQGKASEGLGPIFSRLLGDVLIRMGEEQRIHRIEIKGNRRIESGAINQVLKSSIGAAFSEATLAQDIKAIYKMGYFSDVDAEVDDAPAGKIITFTVQEKGIITSVIIRGNKAISTGDVEGVLTVKPKQVLNLERLKADIVRIKDLYDSKGYYNAEITEAVEKVGERDAHVLFNIVENERLYVRSINFAGNEAFTAKELKGLMTTQEKGFFSFLTDSGILKKEQLKQDVEKITAFYLNHGFIYAQVGEPEIGHDQKGIYVKIPIAEGKQYQVGKVAITGDELQISQKQLLAGLMVTKKSYYDREAVIRDIDYVQQAANDEGYANAVVNPRTTPQDKELTVDVTYELTKGRPVYFNRITITGNTKTRDKVIRRLLAVAEGDIYSKTQLKKSYMAISRLRYFEEIDFQSERGPDDTLTDVNIRIREKPTGMFSIGAGYSATDNAMLFVQIAQQNLFGRGQSLSLRGNLGGRSTSYELSFVEPWLFDIPLWMRADLWKFYRNYDTFQRDSQGGGLTFGYPIWEYVTGYVGYKLSNDTVKDVAANASTFIKKQEGSIVSSILTGTLTRDSTDDIIFPSTGSKNSFSVEYAGGLLQGDASFVKYTVSSSWFFPLPVETVFAIKGRAGLITETEGREVPVYERFYLGGINSLRGLRSVGPVDPASGDVIGGLTMLNFNAEFIFPLIKNAGMKGVFFHDTGNSWNSGYHLGDMRKTAGAGIRWYSPIGPLRLEWGYVLDPQENESRTRWEFTMGMFM